MKSFADKSLKYVFVGMCLSIVFLAAINFSINYGSLKDEGVNIGNFFSVLSGGGERSALPRGAKKFSPPGALGSYFPDDTTPPQNQYKFRKWLSTNSDFVGYLKIPGTKISFPVVQTQDNDYYLTHNFEKKSAASGAIFADYRNDFESLQRNTIIYGHHMKNKTMFADLLNYKDSDYFESAPYIYFDTVYGKTTWAVFAAYITSVDFYYIETDFQTEESFQNLIDEIVVRSIRESEVVMTSADKMLTLSTCDYSFDNARFVVHAKLVEGYE